MPRIKKRPQWYYEVEDKLRSVPQWRVAIEAYGDMIRGDANTGISYDRDLVQTSYLSDTTLEIVIERLESGKAKRLSEINQELRVIEEAMNRTLIKKQITILQGFYFERPAKTADVIGEKIGYGRKWVYNQRDRAIETLAKVMLLKD